MSHRARRRVREITYTFPDSELSSVYSELGNKLETERETSSCLQDTLSNRITKRRLPAKFLSETVEEFRVLSP